MTHDIEIKQKNGWAGTIKVQIPRHPDRLKLIVSSGARNMIQPKKGASEEEREEALVKNLDVLIIIYDKGARALVQAVDLKGPDGEAVSDVDGMESHEDLTDVWITVAAQYIAGYGPKEDGPELKLQALAILQKREYRGPFIHWFSLYASKELFRKLGYTESFSEIMDDEAEWFKAVDTAYADGNAALKQIKDARVSNGKKNI